MLLNFFCNWLILIIFPIKSPKILKQNTKGITMLQYKNNNLHEEKSTQITPKKYHKKAFTLMELMVVIIILGLLASFILPSLTGKSDEAKTKITCIQMKNISQAVKMFKIDNGNYPSTSEGLGMLVEKSYFEDGKLPKDSWSNDFIYTSTGDGFEIISLGEDKAEGGDDDIYYSKCSDQK